jgi:hypothetical protein
MDFLEKTTDHTYKVRMTNLEQSAMRGLMQNPWYGLPLDQEDRRDARLRERLFNIFKQGPAVGVGEYTISLSEPEKEMLKDLLRNPLGLFDHDNEAEWSVKLRFDLYNMLHYI